MGWTGCAGANWTLAHNEKTLSLYLGFQTNMISSALHSFNRVTGTTSVLLNREAEVSTFRNMASDFWILKFLAEKEQEKQKERW